MENREAASQAGLTAWKTGGIDRMENGEAAGQAGFTDE
jgi:hypothetical protein